MGKKLTLDEVKEEFVKRGYIPLFSEYKNVDEKLLAETKEGYKFLVNVSCLQRSIPSIIHKKNPYTIDNIRLWLKINNKPFKLLSTCFEKSCTKLQLVTNEGYKVEISWNNLKQNQNTNIFDSHNSHTIENIKLWLELNNKPFKLINSSYKGSTDKLQLITPEDYKVETCWTYLREGSSPYIFGNGNKFTIFNIKLWLKINNKNFDLLSNTYIRNDLKLRFKCKKDGYTWESSWSTILEGAGCPKCGGTCKITLNEARQVFFSKGYIPLFNEYKNNSEKLTAKTQNGYKISISLQNLKAGKKPHIFDMRNPYTLENIKLYIKLNNIKCELISTEYNNINDNLEFITPEGYKIVGAWASVKNESLPYIFRESNPHTIENIHLYLKLINSPYKLLSTKYINNTSKLTWLCPIHGEFKLDWSNFQQGCGCRLCAIERVSGENCHLWKGGTSKLHEYLRGKITQWKKDSMKACNYKCIITGENYNAIHHLYGFDLIVQELISDLKLNDINFNKIKINDIEQEQLNKIENKCLELHYKYGLGICIREDVHKLFHKEYNYGNNTPQQFEEFKQRYYRGEFDAIFNNK